MEVEELQTGFTNQPKVRSYPLMPCQPYAVVRLFREEPRLKFRHSVFGQRAQYTYSVKWGQLRDGFFLLPLDKIVHTAIVVPNVEADPSCAVPSPSPLDGGFFVIPSRDQLCEDFLDVIRRESADLESESEEEDSEEGEEEEEDSEEGEEEDDEGEEEDDEGEEEDDEEEEEDDEEGEDKEGEEEDDESESDDDSGISFIECKRVNYLRKYIENLNLE